MNLIKEIKKALGCGTTELCGIFGFPCRRVLDQHLAGTQNMSWSMWLRCYVSLTEESRRSVFEAAYTGEGEVNIKLRAVRVNEELLAIAVFRKFHARRKSTGMGRNEFLEATGSELSFGTLKNYELNCPTQAHTKCVFKYLRCWNLETAWSTLENVIRENTK